jgi:four helix bundle protein
MKNQLGGSSLSIMLNIAEGTAKTSSKERRNFYVIARGSAFESASLIKFLAFEKEIPEETAITTYQTFEEISKMLFAMIKSLTK